MFSKVSGSQNSATLLIRAVVKVFFFPKESVADILQHARLLRDEEIVHGQGRIKQLGLKEAEQERLLPRLLVLIGGLGGTGLLFLLLLLLLLNTCRST